MRQPSYWTFQHKANNDGCTPLFIAAQKIHADVVNILVAHGADVDLSLLRQENPQRVRVALLSRRVKRAYTRVIGFIDVRPMTQ